MAAENDATELEFEMKGSKHARGLSETKLTGDLKEKTFAFRSLKKNLRLLISVSVAVILFIICIVLLALLVTKSAKDVSNSDNEGRFVIIGAYTMLSLFLAYFSQSYSLLVV